MTLFGKSTAVPVALCKDLKYSNDLRNTLLKKIGGTLMITQGIAQSAFSPLLLCSIFRGLLSFWQANIYSFCKPFSPFFSLLERMFKCGLKRFLSLLLLDGTMLKFPFFSADSPSAVYGEAIQCHGSKVHDGGRHDVVWPASICCSTVCSVIRRGRRLIVFNGKGD